MFADLGAQGHDPRGAAEDPARAATTTSPTSSCARSRSGASTIRTGVTVHRPHAQRRRRHDGALRRRRARSRSTPSSCRSAAARSPTCSGSTARRSRSTSGASSRSTSAAAPASRASTRSATSSTRRSSPTSASPRRSWSIKDILGEGPVPVDYDKVPWAIYCHPEVAFAGPLARRRPRRPGYDVVVAKHRFRANSRALIVGETDGLVKIIAEKDADGTAGRILGVHMVGPWVTEQLGQGYLAVNWEATVDEVAAVHPAAPDLSELFGETVLALTGRGACTACMADVTMPQLGETVTEGTITKWFKQVGDAGRRRRAAVRGLDRQGRLRGAVAGRPATLTEILVPEGDTVDVGAVLAVVGDGAARRAGRRAAAPRRGAAPAAEAAGRRAGAGAGARSPSRQPAPAAGAGAAHRPPRRAAGRRARRRRRAAAAGARRAGAGRRRRRQPAAVAGRAPAGRRARPRPGRRSRAPAPAGASPATTCSTTSTPRRRRRRRAGRRARAGRPRPRRRRARRAAGARARRAAPRRRPRRRRPRAAPCAAPASATRSCRCRNIRKRTGEHMVHVEGDVARTSSASSRSTTKRRRAPAPRSRTSGRPRRASASPTCRSSPGRVVDALREFPHLNASVGDGELIVHHVRRPRHRRRPRLRGPARAGDPRRRRQAPAGHRPRDQRPRRPGPHQEAVARRDRGGTFTITNTGSAGTVLTVADHQPAAGRRSSRPTASSAGRSSSTGPTAARRIAIHSGRQPGAELGPPRLRRRLRRRLPAPGQGRSSRPATGTPSS